MMANQCCWSVTIIAALLVGWPFATAVLGRRTTLGYYGGGGIRGALRSETEMRWLFEEWLVRSDKSYAEPGEKERRLEIFKDNLRFIDEHNHPRHNHTYTVGLTSLADLTNEEYRAKYLNPLINQRANSSSPEMGDGVDGILLRQHVSDGGVGQNLPPSVDWRTTGAVGPVINQGECGSCWAWTANGAVEGLHQIRTGNMIVLSAQQLVDCDKGSSGCAGGHVGSALRHIARNGGVDTNENYPYIKKDGTCRNNADKVVSIDFARSVFPRNELSFRTTVARQPFGIALEAVGRAFQHYNGGIFNGKCGARLDHAMLLIGYGTENGQDYWLVKNTYGISWGEDGFIRMERNGAHRNGICGILSLGDYPEIRNAP